MAEPRAPGKAAIPPGYAAARLTSRSAGAWVDLVEDLGDRRVLVLDAAPGRSIERLGTVAAVVGIPAAGPEWDRVRRDLAPDVVEIAPLDDLLARTWDVVVIDGDPLTNEWVTRATDALTPTGRVVAVADNRLSPLRTHARVRGGPAAPWAAWSLGSIQRRLQRHGLTVERRLALLRSAAVPVVGYDLDTPGSSRTVLDIALHHLEGPRAAAIRMLRRQVGRAAVVPGWLIVAGRQPAAPAEDRPVGRVTYETWDGGLIVRGDPPVALEKFFRSPARADNEVMAVTAARDAGFDLVTDDIARVAPDRVRLGWTAGHTLNIDRLDDAEIARWVERAGTALGRLQALTERSDGSVLVHGDYWFGNLVVTGDRIVGVIDWEHARWGSPDVDREFLIQSLLGDTARSGEAIPRHRDALERGLESARVATGTR